MISNPYLGQHVQYSSFKGWYELRGKQGTITNSQYTHLHIQVQFDGMGLPYGCLLTSLDPLSSSPEEEARRVDQQQREAHANKYL